MGQGKDFGVGHDEHTIQTYMRARDEDAWDVQAVRLEDDVMHRNEEDGVRDEVFQGRVRLHGQDVR
jgi:hypothetical protein